MSWIRTTRRPAPAPERRSLALIPGPADDTIQASFVGGVGVDRAHRHSAVWAAVALRSDLMSILPVRVFRGVGEKRELLPTPNVLIQPCADMAVDEFAAAVEWCLTLRGNAYAKVTEWDSLLYPRRVELLHPDFVWADYDEKTGATRYRVNGKQIDPADVLHIRRRRTPGSPEGMSALSYARQSILTGLAAEDFSYRFFNDGAHPTALLKAAKAINDQAAKTAKARFLAALNGRREPVVLGGDWSYEQIQVNPEDSQFLETMQASDVTIARFLRVPATMIDAAAPNGGAITYQNIESRASDFLTYYMQAGITRYESWLGKCFTPRGQYVLLDTDVMVRTDAMTQAKVDRLRLFNAQTNPNELRARDGHGTIPEGDKFAWPLAAPQEMAKSVPVQGT